MRRPVALRFLALVLILMASGCRSEPLPPAAPLPSPTPRPRLFLELEAEEGPLRVLDDGRVAQARFGEDEYGDWQMLVDFDEEGTALLKEATEENVDKLMRVLLGEEVLLSARIMEPIEDGRMLLTGLSAEQADALKAILGDRTGRK